MTLSEYLIAYLGNLATDLGYTSGSLSVVVSDTLLEYEVDTEAEAIDFKKLYAIAKVIVWKKILTDLVTAYNFSADGGNFQRSQMYDMAMKNYQDCINSALPYLSGYAIEVGEINFTDDPYKNDEWEW